MTTEQIHTQSENIFNWPRGIEKTCLMMAVVMLHNRNTIYNILNVLWRNYVAIYARSSLSYLLVLSVMSNRIRKVHKFDEFPLPKAFPISAFDWQRTKGELFHFEMYLPIFVVLNCMGDFKLDNILTTWFVILKMSPQNDTVTVCLTIVRSLVWIVAFSPLLPPKIEKIN